MIIFCTCPAFEPTGNADVRPQSAHMSLASAVRYLASLDAGALPELVEEEEAVTSGPSGGAAWRGVAWYDYEVEEYEDGVLLCDIDDGTMLWSVRRLEVQP